jgi:hypothetical protein
MKRWVALFLAIVFAVSLGLTTAYAEPAIPEVPEEPGGFGGCFIICAYGGCGAIGWGCVCKCVNGHPICTRHGASSF